MGEFVPPAPDVADDLVRFCSDCPMRGMCVGPVSIILKNETNGLGGTGLELVGQDRRFAESDEVDLYFDSPNQASPLIKAESGGDHHGYKNVSLSDKGRAFLVQACRYGLSECSGPTNKKECPALDEEILQAFMERKFNEGN